MTLIDADGPVGTRVRAVVGVRRLVPLFEVRTRRRLYSLESDAVPAGEIALDETAIHIPAGGPGAHPPSRDRSPEPALEQLGLFVRGGVSLCAPAGFVEQVRGRSFVQRSRPPVPLSLGPTDIDPDKPIRAVALAVLRRHFALMLAKEPGTRLGDDIEELRHAGRCAQVARSAVALPDVLPATVMKLSGELARGPAGLSAQSAISTCSWNSSIGG